MNGTSRILRTPWTKGLPLYTPTRQLILSTPRPMFFVNPEKCPTVHHPSPRNPPTISGAPPGKPGRLMVNSEMGLGKPEVTVLKDDSHRSRNGYKYQLSMYIGQRGFTSHNIQVKVDEDSGVLMVEAKEDGKGERRLCSEIIRQFELPENVDLHEIKTALSPDGILTVQVPLPQPPNTPKDTPVVWSRKHWT